VTGESYLAVSLLGLVLAFSAVTGLVQWRHRPVPSPRLFRSALAGVLVPLLLLGSAAWFAVGDEPLHGHPAAVVVAIAGLTAVLGGSLVVESILVLADRRTYGRAAVPPGPPPPAAPVPAAIASAAAPTTHGPADPEILRGGAWIGTLERIAVVATLLTGWPEGLLYVLAVKGLGRYPELRAPAATERFILGTFTSVLWAAGCAGVAAMLVAVR